MSQIHWRRLAAVVCGWLGYPALFVAGIGCCYFWFRPQDEVPASPKTKFEQASELEAQAKAQFEEAAELREQGIQHWELREEKFERLLDLLRELFPDKFGKPEPDIGGDGKSSSPDDSPEEE